MRGMGVSGDESSRLRVQRRRWRPLAVGAALVLIVVGRVSSDLSGAHGVDVVLYAVAAAVVVALIALLVPRAYRRNVDAMYRGAAPGAWVRNVKLPEDSQAWRAISVEDGGVRLLEKGGGTAAGPWPYADIVSAEVGRVGALLAEHPGVVLTLRSGEVVRLLLPEHIAPSYPEQLAQECVEQIERRARAASVPPGTKLS